jgi:hypothetical protein
VCGGSAVIRTNLQVRNLSDSLLQVDEIRIVRNSSGEESVSRLNMRGLFPSIDE